MHTVSLRQSRLFHSLLTVEEEIRRKGRMSVLYRMIPAIRNSRWAGFTTKECWRGIVSLSQKCSSVNLIVRKSQGRLGNVCSKAQTMIGCLHKTFCSPSTIIERCWDAMFPSRTGAFARGYRKYRLYRRELCERHGYAIFTVLAALCVGMGLVML
jgi:hypothetical protein